MYYDVNQTLSYNCLFNFVIGARGCGKSYGLKKRAIKQFKEKGYHFVYLRRFQDEVDETAPTYFDDIIANNEFPDDTIKYEAGCFYINDEIFGYSMALTKAKLYKSISFPLVMLIIFDEFLIEENGYAHYIKNEVKNFLGLYMSVDRYRGCVVFFLANSTSMVNPYTLYFDLRLPYGSNFIRRGDLLLQMVNNEDYVNNRKQTRFGKMIEGTDFADYVIDNKFVDDSKNFICKKTEHSEYYFTVIYMGVNYGIWIDYKEGKIFLSNNVDPSCRMIYAITNSDHQPNTMLLKGALRSPYIKNFISQYKMGNVYFENVKLKSVGNEIIKLCIC